MSLPCCTYGRPSVCDSRVAHWHAASSSHLFGLYFTKSCAREADESVSGLCPFHGLSSNLYVKPDLSAVESPVPLSGSSCPIKHTPLFVSVQTLGWIFNSLCLEAPFHKFFHVVVWTLLRTLSDGKPLPSPGGLLDNTSTHL